MSTDTRDFTPGGLRVSDADRDQAAAELSGHFEAGRITSDEFDERASRALQAKTQGDLDELFADLPKRRAAAAPPTAADLPPSAGPGPVRPFGGMGLSRRLPGAPIIVWVLLAAVLAGGASGGFHHSVIFLAVPILVAIAVVRRLARYR